MNRSSSRELACALASGLLGAGCGTRHLALGDDVVPRSTPPPVTLVAGAPSQPSSVVPPFIVPMSVLCLAGSNDCGSSGYCEFSVSSECMSGTGRCVSRPMSCTLSDPPLCGCDGKLYPNACASNFHTGVVRGGPSVCGAQLEDAGIEDHDAAIGIH